MCVISRYRLHFGNYLKIILVKLVRRRMSESLKKATIQLTDPVLDKSIIPYYSNNNTTKYNA